MLRVIIDRRSFNDRLYRVFDVVCENYPSSVAEARKADAEFWEKFR